MATSEERLRATLAHEELVKNEGEFLDAIIDVDDLKAVVLCHAWVDHALNLLVDRHLWLPSVQQTAKMGFMVKARLAMAMGEMMQAEFQLFEAIAGIRNKFAHNLKYVLGPSDSKLITEAIANTHLKKYVGAVAIDIAEDTAYSSEQSLVRIAIFTAYKHCMGKLSEPAYSPEELLWNFQRAIELGQPGVVMPELGPNGMPL